MKSYPKAVVALAGARDRYQLPLALHEGEFLQTLVTDMYWPADKKWFSRTAGAFLSERAISARFAKGLESGRVRLCGTSLLAFALMKAAPQLDFNRAKDKSLGRKARQIALRKGASLFCYSYYASECFKGGGDKLPFRFLFQLHPHPTTVRRMLLEEAERTPEAKTSLMMEHEVSLPQPEFDQLSREPLLANGWVTASTYTAKTLAEHGVKADQIHVVPYGVDRGTFAPRPAPPNGRDPFTVVYLGSLIQRKGLSYLLEAMRRLKSRNIKLILCGRGLIDRQLINRYGDADIELKIALPDTELVRQIYKGDVFVLPSLSEGFAHVILEVMSCGLPVITTSHSCAPDVIADGVHGFIVPIRDSEAIAERLHWGIEHRVDLAAMGEAAAAQAKHFTWERFREGVREAYKRMIISARQES
jgi:hypothetical protein